MNIHNEIVGKGRKMGKMEEKRWGDEGATLHWRDRRDGVSCLVFSNILIRSYGYRCL